MVEKRELTCIACPIGCSLQVFMDDGKVTEIKGNSCEKGAAYGEKECINPTRIVTSTVKVKDGRRPMVSVKTESDVPKVKVFECMKELKGIIVKAPVKIGDIIVENAANTGVNFIATRNIEYLKKA